MSSVLAWIDGGSRGNPGEAGAGIVLELAGGQRERHSLYLDRATSNEAEYAALLAALERLATLGVAGVSIFSDSELLVHQMNGVYRVRAGNLRPLWGAAQQLAGSFRLFSIRHIPRQANAEADRLANQAMDSRRSTLPVPRLVQALNRRPGRRHWPLVLGEEEVP